MNTRRIFINVAVFLFAVLVVSIVVASIVTSNLLVYARTSTTINYYMTSNIATINGVTGYGLNTTQTSSPILVNASYAWIAAVQWGYRVWKVESNNATTELTTGTPAAIANRLMGVNGTGLQSSTWTPPTTSLNIGFDSLKIVAYQKWVPDPWTAIATFTTARLSEATLLNETVTFYTWTNRTEVTATAITYMQFRFGSSTYNTRIEDVGYAEPYPPESQLVELENQNFWGFIMYPMNYVFGSLSYGIFLLLINVPLIKRYNSFVPTLILFILFGGAAGAFTLMIPEIGLSIGWIFMVIGLGGLLWKWTR